MYFPGHRDPTPIPTPQTRMVVPLSLWPEGIGLSFMSVGVCVRGPGIVASSALRGNGGSEKGISPTARDGCAPAQTLYVQPCSPWDFSLPWCSGRGLHRPRLSCPKSGPVAAAWWEVGSWVEFSAFCAPRLMQLCSQSRGWAPRRPLTDAVWPTKVFLFKFSVIILK